MRIAILLVLLFGSFAFAGDSGLPPASFWSEAALQVSADIVSRAVVDSAGARWEIKERQDDGTVVTRRHARLWDGTAGIVVFLADVYRLTGDASVKRIAEEGGRWLGSAEAATSVYDNALYTGRAGCGWAYCSLYESLGDRAWLKKAEAIGSRMASQDSQWLDVIYGSSGEGLLFLELHKLTGNPRWLAAARRRGDWLLGHAVPSDGGLKWPVGLDQAWSSIYYTGMAHGTAGVGYFLARLSAATGTSGGKYLSGAKQAAAYLRQIAVIEAGTPDWYRREPDQMDVYQVQWCHGTPGIGIFFLELFRVTRNAADLEMARNCGRAVLTRGMLSSCCLCHGAAGNAELLLGLYRQTKQKIWLDKALAAGNRLWSRRDLSSGLPRWYSDDGSGAQNPNLYLGSAGIGEFFLSLANPTSHGMPVTP